MNTKMSQAAQSLPESESTLELLAPKVAYPAIKLIALVAQLGLVLLVAERFEIGGSSFLRILILAIAGFMVRLTLPRRWQLSFFVILSLIGTGWVVGPVTTAWLLAIGLLILAICHLPISFAQR